MHSGNKLEELTHFYNIQSANGGHEEKPLSHAQILHMAIAHAIDESEDSGGKWEKISTVVDTTTTNEQDALLLAQKLIDGAKFSKSTFAIVMPYFFEGQEAAAFVIAYNAAPRKKLLAAISLPVPKSIDGEGYKQHETLLRLIGLCTDRKPGSPMELFFVDAPPHISAAIAKAVNDLALETGVNESELSRTSLPLSEMQSLLQTERHRVMEEMTLRQSLLLSAIGERRLEPPSQ